MNKTIFYTLLVVIYLALSKTFSPDNSGIEYIRTSRDLNKIISRAPAEVILLQTLSKGFLIKTYYQRYRIVYGFQAPREVVVRTKRSFSEYSQRFKGMSLFRKFEDNTFNTTPMPPGQLFIGNRQFGRWVFKNKAYFWSFYRAYQNFPQYFGWGKFVPTKEFYQSSLDSQKKGVSYHGDKQEFGIDGSLTQKFFSNSVPKSSISKIRLKTLLSEYFKTNYTY